MDQKALRERFIEFTAQFNQGQQKAAHQIEGTMLVIAGPGTGKTQVLAARIGHILQSSEAQAAPENILCITFTNAGVMAMRKRLLGLIGPDAYRVTIETFHSFCNQIIQDNPEYFIKKDLRQITEIEEISLIRQMTDRFPKNHPLKRYGNAPYYDVPRFRKLYSLMKTEVWEPEWMKRKVDEYIHEIQQDKTNGKFFYQRPYKQCKPGDAKKELGEEIKKMNVLKAAIDTYPEYTKTLEEEGLYDYNDMLIWTLQGLEKHETLLARYQERFLYILVDEFQDSNDAQNKVVAKLCEFWDNPNLFVVGDDDQSIYRFQGANIRNILDLQNHYQQIKSVVLTHNYRSNQGILDAAQKVISNNSERITQLPGFEGIEKTLLADGPEKNSPYTPPIIYTFPNPIHEYIGIVKWIETLEQKGIPLKEAAVIYREHAEAEDLIKYFEQKKIPFQLKRTFNILYDPLIQQCLRVFEYAHEEFRKPGSRDDLLFEIIHYPWIAEQPMLLADEIIALKHIEKDSSSLRQILRKIPFNTQGNLLEQRFEQATQLKKISQWIEKIIPLQVTLPLQQWFEYILKESGMYPFCFSREDKDRILTRLRTFFDWVKEETRKKPDLTPGGILQILKIMEEYRLQIPQEEIYAGEGGITLTTAHGSKGLEWESVWIMDAQAPIWERPGRNETFALPDNLIQETRTLNNQADIEEARRLFFVGMTRAKKELYISYPQNNLNEKAIQPARFVVETEIAPIEKSFSTEEVNLWLFSTMGPTITEDGIPLINDAILQEILQNYTLSVTHLNSYLACPVSFYYDNLLRVPSAKNGAMAFGSAVHRAYHKYFLEMKEQGDFPAVERLVKLYEYELSKEKEAFTPEDYDRRKEYGIQILQAHQQRYKAEWSKIVSLEKNVSTVVYEGIPLKGFMDKIEYEGNHVRIIDYKTGKYKSDKFLSPDEEQDGGDYWRQAAFYHVLYTHDSQRPLGKTLEYIAFDFLEPDDKTGDFTFRRVAISPEDVEQIGKQIQTVYQKIKNKEFHQGCGECYWCQLQKKL